MMDTYNLSEFGSFTREERCQVPFQEEEKLGGKGT